MGRVIGELTARDAGKLTVKTDAGSSYSVDLNEKTLFLRVPPGEKDLKKASRITLDDLKVGDRVMARGVVSEEQKSVPAVSVIVMTKEDLAQKQQREQAEWQTRGTTGQVTTVNPGGKDFVISARTRAGVSSLTTVVVNDATKIRRYSPDSVRFADATPATLSDIQPGDQARLLGKKNEDGTRLEAEEIVFGTFRTIAGTVISADAANNEIKLNDLATKKPVTIKLNAGSQLKKLPPMAAMILARRLNPSFQGGTVAAGGLRPNGAGPGAQGASPQANGPGSGGAVGGDHPRMGGGGAPNMEQMLERLPSFTLADLQPGEPLIVSTTARPGTNVANAITVLSDVEPILRAAPAGSGVNLGSWSIEMNMPVQ